MNKLCRSHRSRWCLLVVPLLIIFTLLLGACQAIVAPTALDPDSTQSDPDEDENEVRPDRPSEADAFRLLSLQDENDQIAPDAAIQAAQQMNLMQAAQQNNFLGNFLGVLNWEFIGPGNIGGRVRALLMHPTITTTMWAGSVSGGVFKTIDGGASWKASGLIGNPAVTSLVINPNDTNILWAATGEGFGNIDSIRGAGIFKSMDGGASWSQLSFTANVKWYWVNRLAISPGGATLLAVTVTPGTIWRSTDGGESWAVVGGGDFTDVKFHPIQSQFAVAGARTTAYYSINSGLSWAQSTGLPTGERVELAYARSASNTVYASVNVNGGEIWKSSNGGQSYSKMTTNANDKYLSTQGWYANTIWVDPTNENNLVVGGLDLWRSNDGGATLTKISDWQIGFGPKSAHADQHTIVQSPGFNGTSNKTVFFGNDGGVYKTDDIDSVSAANPPNGWVSLNNHLGMTQFFGAAGNPTSGIIVGGAQDNGTLRYSGDTNNWTMMFGGDGGFSASDPTDPNYFYGEYVYLQIHRSTDGGRTSKYISAGLTDAGASPPKGTGCALFIAPFILDPNNPNTMYAGACRLWRSTNVKAPVPTWQPILGPTDGKISAIAVTAGNPNEIWVGTENGAVYHTNNGTAAAIAWQRDDVSAGLPDRYVTRITISRPQRVGGVSAVYVTFGGYSTNNVWRHSLVWEPLNGTGASALPAAPVRSLVVHPDFSRILFVGTEVGIFASDDFGVSWDPFRFFNPLADGPFNVSVDELFWMNHVLVAATHGRGLYRIDLSVYLHSVGTRDTNGNLKSTFAPGEPIRYEIFVASFIVPSADVIENFEAHSPDGQLEYATQRVQTIIPDIQTDFVDTIVPNNVGGIHTFTGSVTFEGHTQRLGITYTVTGPSGPINDNFAAALLTAGTETINSNSTGATTEGGESAPCATIGSTIWYHIVPDQSGTLTASTAGSAFDTVLALYTGSSIATLSNVACNNDATGIASASALSFAVVAGQSYYLQLGGLNGAKGVFQLVLGYAAPTGPANDTFAAAAPLGVPGTIGGSSDGATNEGNEPAPCGLIGNTLWYKIVPDQSTTLIASSADSEFDTVLALYSGSSIATLTNLACNDDSTGGISTSELRAEVIAGQIYYLQLGGFSGATGAFKLNLHYPPPPTAPSNDNLAAAVSLAVPSTVESNNIGATIESSEPMPCGLIGNSLWYKIVPGLSTTLIANTSRSGFDTVLALYRGDSIDALADEGCNDDGADNGEGDTTSHFTATVVGGQTYYLQLGGFDSASGTTQLDVAFIDAKQDTTFDLQLLNTPAEVGAQITFVARLLPDSPLQTGEVEFYHEGGLLGTAPLSDRTDATTGAKFRAAEFSINDLPPGRHSIRVSYAGDSIFNAATSEIVPQFINGQQNTTLDLHSNQNPTAIGQKVTLTARVLPQADRQTGNVTFFDGTTVLGQATLQNGCPASSVCRQASFEATALTVGTHLLTAQYEGDSNYKASTSNIVTQTVTAEAGVALTPISLTVAAGSKAIQLQWNVTNDPTVTSYRILRNAGQNDRFRSLAENWLNPVYADKDDDGSNNLVPALTYCYQVEALRGNGIVVVTSDTVCWVFGTLDLFVPETLGRLGETVIVPVNIRNADGLRIAASDIWLEFNSDIIESVSVSNTALTAAYTWDFSVQETASPPTKQLRIALISSQPEALYGPGALFWLIFKVKGQAGQSSPLDLKEFISNIGGSSIQDSSDPSQDVPLQITDGLFRVGATNAGFALGDVDGDGVVRAVDALRALRLAVGNALPSAGERRAGDVNSSGAVNGADVSMILSYAVRGAWPVPTKQNAASASALQVASVVRLSSAQAQAGQHVLITLAADSLSQMAGGDFALTYDPRVIKGVVNVTPAALAANFAVDFHAGGNGLLTIALGDDAEISGSGDLLTIELELLANAAPGASPLTFASASLNDAFGRDFVTNFANNTLTRQSGTITVTKAGTNNTVYLPVISK